MENNTIKNIVIAGSGNVVEAIALAVHDCPTLSLRQIVARNSERVQHIASLAECDWCSDLSQAADADLYIISVSDRAVEQVAQQGDAAIKALAEQIKALNETEDKE